MVTKDVSPLNTKQSLLSKFHLDYELDKTWQEAKHDVKRRTER